MSDVRANCIEALFEAEDRRLKKIKDKLVEDNNKLNDTDYICFVFNGDYYVHSSRVFFNPGYAPSVSSPTTCLHLSLTNRMREYITDKKTVDSDRHQIAQILYRILRTLDSIQQYRNAMPECIVSLVPSLSSLQRTADQLEYFNGDERLIRQYNSLLPKIEMYSVTRFIY
jgi:hypothetical protein